MSSDVHAATAQPAPSEDCIHQVRMILISTLQVDEDSIPVLADTALLGELPELDSMAVVSVLTALEEYYSFFIEDDEISADTFETLGSLTDFVVAKLAE